MLSCITCNTSAHPNLRLQMSQIVLQSSQSSVQVTNESTGDGSLDLMECR